MYFDESRKVFVEKKSSFTILLITSKGNKVAGTCTFEISNYLNQNLYSNIYQSIDRLFRDPKIRKMSRQKCRAQN